MPQHQLKQAMPQSGILFWNGTHLLEWAELEVAHMKCKNYGLALLNVAVAGLLILVGWDWILYGFYFVSAVLFIALTAWNAVGDYIAVLFVFHARRVPQEAQITPALNRFCQSATAAGKISGNGCKFYYAESRIPYFIPISRRRIVLSTALEEYLIADKNGRLFCDVPALSYDPPIVFSRKVLLMSIICYVVVLRFGELMAIIGAAVVRFCMAVAMVIATGAIFEGLWKMIRAILIGVALGTVIWKINEAVNFVQDKAVDFLMKQTMRGTFDYLKKSGQPAGQGLRLTGQRRTYT